MADHSEALEARLDHLADVLGRVERKLDEHVQEHREAAGRWRQGVVGMLFTVLGTGILWVGHVLLGRFRAVP